MTRARGPHEEGTELDAATLLRDIPGLTLRPDGGVQLDGDRQAHLDAVGAILERGCDVTVQMDGFETSGLPLRVRSLFDFAVDAGVPVQVRHRGRLLTITAAAT